ncbi:hypothetical protein FRC03_011118 [Tulasnella sp. 419]|nr:hypothetical protein FRC03_011118 [Tulasnella sp. 419]
MSSTASVSSDAASKALALLLEDFRSREQSQIGDTQTIKEPESPHESLERNVKELEIVLAGFVDRVRQAIAGVRRQQNILALIHRLPIEVLQHIFLLRASEAFLCQMNESLLHKENIGIPFRDRDEEDIDEEDDRSYGPDYQDLNYALALRLSQVCSYWYKLAFAQPRIWSYLDSRFNVETTELYLERSKRTPLFITCSRRVGFHRESKFMKLVMPHLDRWRAFNSYSENRILLMHVLPKRNYSLPSLESFMIHVSAGALMDIPTKLYERTPNLREFHVEWPSFPFQMGSQALSNLTSLGIRNAFKDRGFTMGDYELLFASCPQLQTMFITDAHDWACLAELPTFSVRVPNLKSLHLYRFDPRLVSALLFSLFPDPANLPTIKVLGSCNPDVSKQAFMDTSRVGSFMDLVCRNMAGLSTKYFEEIDGDYGLLQIWRESEGKQFTFLEFTHTMRCFGETAISLLSPNTPSILRELSLTTLDDVAGNLAPNLSCCPHLEHLTITAMHRREWWKEVICLIADLAFPDGGTRHATSSPQIKRLSLKDAGYDVLRAMPELLNARHESTQTLLMDSGLLHRLEKLDVQLAKIRYSTDPLIDPGSTSEIEMLLAPRGIAFKLVDI